MRWTAAVAAGWAVSYAALGVCTELAAVYVLVLLLVLAARTDLKHRRILNIHTYPAFVLLLVYRMLVEHLLPPLDYVLGAVAGFALLYGLSLLTQGGVGGGDMKLYAAAGLVLGWQLTLLSLFLASLLGAVYGIVRRRSGSLPFAPFAAAGCVLAYGYGLMTGISGFLRL